MLRRKSSALGQVQRAAGSPTKERTIVAKAASAAASSML
jgi:hypothetical protein